MVNIYFKKPRGFKNEKNKDLEQQIPDMLQLDI